MRFRAPALRTCKFAFAFLLMAFSVVSSAGTMRCFFGLPMTEVVAVAPVEATDCCPSKVEAPKPEPTKPDCCCIEVMEKSILEVNKAGQVAFQFDFPIIESPLSEFAYESSIIQVEQIRWPEVHGPPGIVLPTSSPRAPPVA